MVTTAYNLKFWKKKMMLYIKQTFLFQWIKWFMFYGHKSGDPNDNLQNVTPVCVLQLQKLLHL